tara:strand:- start:442 stop:618 length:177 start_codon:yes stop_codon:yes gene_type:complete
LICIGIVIVTGQIGLIIILTIGDIVPGTIHGDIIIGTDHIIIGATAGITDHGIIQDII